MPIDALNVLNIVPPENLPKTRNKWKINATDADATTHEELKAGVTGRSHYITRVHLNAALATTLAIEDDSTTIIGPIAFPATGGNSWDEDFPEPIKITAGAAINILQVGAGDFNVILEGFTEVNEV